MGQVFFTLVLMALAAVGGASFSAKQFTGDWSPMAVLTAEADVDEALPMATPCDDLLGE